MKRVAGHDARVEGERRTKTNSCSGGTVAFRKAGSTTQWCRRSSCTACTSVHNDRWLEFSGLASQIYADVNKVARYTKLCDVCPANILYHHATAIDIIDANMRGRQTEFSRVGRFEGWQPLIQACLFYPSSSSLYPSMMNRGLDSSLFSAIFLFREVWKGTCEKERDRETPGGNLSN